jgi:hypothetical protein
MDIIGSNKNFVTKLLAFLGDNNLGIYYYSESDLDYKEFYSIGISKYTKSYNKEKAMADFFTVNPQYIDYSIATLRHLIKKETGRYNDVERVEYEVVVLNKNEIKEKYKNILKPLTKEFFSDTFWDENMYENDISIDFLTQLIKNINKDHKYKVPSFLKLSSDDIVKLHEVLDGYSFMTVISNTPKTSLSQCDVFYDFLDSFVSSNFDKNYHSTLVKYLKKVSSFSQISNKIENNIIKYVQDLSDENVEELIDFYPSLQKVFDKKIDYSPVFAQNLESLPFSYVWKKEDFLSVLNQKTYVEIYPLRDKLMDSVFKVFSYTKLFISNMGGNEYMYTFVPENKSVPILTMQEFTKMFNEALNIIINDPQERNYQALEMLHTKLIAIHESHKIEDKIDKEGGLVNRSSTVRKF